MRQKIEEIIGQRNIDIIHSAYVVHTLYQQQKLGKYCDLKVLVGDKQYFVHRCVLAAASAQLDSQINGLDTIQLVGVTYYGFEGLLEILYSGKLKDIACLSDIRFQQIVSAADALNAETVMEYCTRERGDLMNLLMHQSANNAANLQKQNSPKNETEGNAVENKDSSYNNSNSNTETDNLNTCSPNTADDMNNKDIAEYRRTNSMSRSSRSSKDDGEYLHAPVAAEVEVMDNINGEVPESSGNHTNTLPPPSGNLIPADGSVEQIKVKVENNHTEGSEAASTCSVCGAVLLNPLDLQSHMQSHAEASMYRCEICGLHFKFQTNLFKHKKLHNSELICHICGLEFKVVEQLQNHMQILHQQDGTFSDRENTPYYKEPQPVQPPQKTKRKTTIMDTSDITPIAVNDIMRGPNGKYNCPLCERGFDRRWNLKCHVLIHTAARRTGGETMSDMRYIEGGFDCPVCGKAFRNLHNLRRHASSQHGMSAAALSEASESKLNEHSATVAAKRAKTATQRKSENPPSLDNNFR
uniref:zinc finger protein (C2H2)-41 isoform X1 n=1 Tax=Ciona intestinalis TaxID=7719 RepID=UPI000EF4E2DE|nr:zinc finger protein (C2H2)-41 isoform X1 [Ciona intestinalis]XP_026691543.1 zinc finger protein (C2H2)-41 isoform X1 [Ciona intestinalis]|eukprot:XP_026691542.1 zinc finger protein (C2H2)-41 isoform X1 [Ciona intestinalis]